MSKADNFDEWFKKTYPEYCCGNTMLEPYYSIASYAWECAEHTLEVELKSELIKKADTNHSLVEQMAKLESDFRICEKNADTYYDLLTKAKELINLFVQWNYGCCKTPDFKDLVKQAEQFLKEIEK